MFTSQLVMDVLDELEEKSATHSTHDASEVVILTDFFKIRRFFLKKGPAGQSRD